MLEEKIYLVLGIGTDIGKTYFIEKICQKLISQNKAVWAIKPIASGFVDGDEKSDTAKILFSLGKNFTPENIDIITPWRFEKAVSPHLAAKAENREVNFSEVVDFCQKNILLAKKQDSFLFIEAAGGVMTPLNDDKTFLDLALFLKIPVLLVSANYLGSISHTLCAVEALKAKNIKIEKIIVNNGLGQDNQNLDVMQTALAFENFSKIKSVLLDVFLD